VNAVSSNAIPLLSTSDRQQLYGETYVSAIVAAAGFNLSKPLLDRGSDDWYIEPLVREDFIPYYSRLLVQVKCSYAHKVNEGYINYPLLLKNYNDLRLARIEPRILVVVLVPRPNGRDAKPWVEHLEDFTVFRHRAYWCSLMGAEPTANSSSVTVKVPEGNLFDIDAISFLMTEMVLKGVKWLSK
jgi:hypothetical protein